MRRFILLAGLALAAIPAIPGTAEAHGGYWEQERRWQHDEWRHRQWERERAWRHREWRRERAWRHEEWRRRQAYGHGSYGHGYGPPVAYAQPGLSITIPFR